MAESKKSSSKGNAQSKKDAQSNAELAEQLRRAAEILDAAEKAEKKSAEKKPATKKPAAKSTASKTPAKKPTTKKPATKAPAKKAEQPKTEPEEQPAQPEEQPVAAAVEQEQATMPAPEQPKQEQPAEEKPAEQPVEEKPVEEKPTEQPAEQPVEEKPAEQPAEQPAKAKPARGERAAAFMNKSNDIINKWGLPLFIIANSLLLLSSIFLMIGSFNFSVRGGGNVSASIFQYFTADSASKIKTNWVTAGEWVDGGYVMIGILMLVAFLVPIALIAKNVVFFILKKDTKVHMLDAIVTFAFLVAYLGIVNLYGANMTWAHYLSIIFSIVLLAYTIFVILLQNRGGAFPFFSIANLVMILLCMFLLTSNKIYDESMMYAAFAAGLSGGGGFAFVMLLFCLAALVLLIVMQVKKLPGKIAWVFEFAVPAAAGVLALIALISYAPGKPEGISMGVGYVLGTVLTMLFAIADVVFALVPQLHKYNVKVADRVGAPAAKAAVQNEEQLDEADIAEQPAQPEQKPEEEAKPAEGDNIGKLYCPKCGMEHNADDVFCFKCGYKLK